MKKIFSFSILAACMGLTVSAQNIQLKNSIDSFSYAAGVNVALTMKQQGVTEMNS